MGVQLVSATFLGRPVGKGCSPSFKGRLAKAEARIRAEYEAALRAGATTETFEDWHNVRSVGGFREGAGMHGRGEAVDLNYGRCPYIATRSGRTFGGEAAGSELGVRRPAVEVYDRACGGPGTADVSGRRRGETVGESFDRFELVNVALQRYFGPYFNTVDVDGTPLVFIRRRPVQGYATAERDAFVGMVGRELKVPLADVPLQVLRDFEAVRIPMVKGVPDRRPAETRNPALGVMNLRRAVVVALVAEGMRWGMDSFGAESSGDGMHFDTAKAYTV